MICPNCLQESENNRKCDNCEFDLSLIKNILEYGEFFHRESLKSLSENNHFKAQKEIITSLKFYPYDIDKLRYAFFMSVDVGDFENAEYCLSIIKEIKIELYEKFNELLNESRSRIRQLLDSIENYGEIPEKFTHSPQTTFENQIVRKFNDSFEPTITRKNKFRYSIPFILIGILILFLIFLLLRLNSVKSTLSASLDSTNEVLKISEIESDSLKNTSDKLKELLITIDNDGDILESYGKLKQAGISIKKRLNNINSKKALELYWSARKLYLKDQYQKAKTLYKKSYELNNSSWFSDDAFYYYLLCLEELKNPKLSKEIEEFLSQYPSSIYQKHAKLLIKNK